jgi:2-methylaconitate cis-trans-isomerase PrpF
MEDFVRIPCTLMRGGTSKGLILKSVHLPSDPYTRDKVITRIYGSPDVRQIDGIGGGTPLTSKLIIVGAPSHPDAHINFTFGQVSLVDNTIDYKPTCGNMSTAVGLYAVQEGYVELTEPVTVVRIFNTNIGKMIEAEVPVKNGRVVYEGDFSIDGVPGKAPLIMINFLDSGGAITGELLPTGKPKDIIKIADGREFDVSVIDSANVVVFVKADQLNITGSELGEEFSKHDLLSTLEAIRVEVGVRIGLVQERSLVTPVSHALPKIAVLAKSQTYKTITDRIVRENEIDLVGRYVAMGVLHQAFAVSGGIAAATGAQIPGTVIDELINRSGDGLIHIGHPSGVITVEAKVERNGDLLEVKRAAVGRTARRLMDGYSYVPIKVLEA